MASRSGRRGEMDIGAGSGRLNPPRTSRRGRKPNRSTESGAQSTTGVLAAAKPKPANSKRPPEDAADQSVEEVEGCRICGKDDDHGNLLICEFCGDEYHTYCLSPPLDEIPEGDWFCDKCARNTEMKNDDGLDALVSALPPQYTSRFGEIVWAAGGAGFGWWPACIYDPRLTVGGARELARKNLGKRHLIYFFECNEAPFTILTDNKLVPWEDGFIEEYDLGKSAKSSGKNRFKHFERALRVAQLEQGRPIEMRMDWNHNDEPVPAKPSRQSKPRASRPAAKKQKPANRKPPCDDSTSGLNRKSINAALRKDDSGTHAIEFSEDGMLVCKILRKPPGEGSRPGENLGFVTLPSRLRATFADIRRAVDEDLDDDVFRTDEKGVRRLWKFHVPKLGPMSSKQEGDKIGPALEFLSRTTDDVNLGNGLPSNPLKIVIVDDA